MTYLLKTTTSLGLIMMMGLPQVTFAQSAEGGAVVVEEGAADAQAVTEELARQTEAEAQAAAEAEAQAAAEAEAQAAAEAEAQAAAEAEAQAAAEAEAQAAAEAETEASAIEETAQADAAPAPTAEQTATQDTLAPEVVEPETAAPQAAQSETPEAAPGEAAVAPETETEAQRAAREALEAEEDQLRAERQAERAREQAESLAALDEAAEAEAELEVETVTSEDVRTSNEEFETAVTTQNRDDDSGLSNFEKALLLGLGAVAVGTILNNGDEVQSRSGDRVIVEREGELRVLKNDDALLRRAGDEVSTRTFNDGSSRTTINRPDGSRIVTVRGPDGTVLQRTRQLPDGQEYVLFDDTRQERQIIVSELPRQSFVSQSASSVEGEDALRAALQAQAAQGRGQAFSLRQIRDIKQVRALAPEIELDAVRFASGSAAIAPEQARSLARIGNTLRQLIENDPRTVLLVEGHTDAVGDAGFNLALSDRRAETVALALTEYFDVPAENMVVQGYGESQLKVPTLANEQANRRAVVRNITSLLR